MPRRKAGAVEIPLCGSKLTTGKGTCKNAAGEGTDHYGFGACKWHTGSTPAGKAHALRLQLEAMPMLGGLRPVEPLEGLLWSIHRSAGMLEWYDLKLQSLESEDELTQSVGGGEYSSPEVKPSVWVRLQTEERRDFARYCKLALDAGVEERAVRVAEQQGQQIAQMFQELIEGLGLNQAQAKKVPGLVRRILMSQTAIETQGELVHA